MENEIGNRIKNCRLKCGLTQMNAADSIGMDRTVYSEIENGKRQASVGEIISLAGLFRVKTDSLLFGDDESASDLPEGLELKKNLLDSVPRYFMANLSANEIIGDVMETNEEGIRMPVKLNAPDGRRYSYDAFQQWWAETSLISNITPYLGKSGSHRLISSYRSGKKAVEIICTVRDAAGNIREMKQTHYLSENKEGDVFTICVSTSVDDSIISRQSSEIAEVLSDSFEGIFYVNIVDDSYVALKTRGAFYNIIQNISGQNFFRSSLRHLRGVIHRDDFDFVSEFVKKESLLEKLKEGNITSTIFRLQVNGTEIYYRLRVSRSESDSIHIILALENVSAFVINERIQNEKLERDKTIIEALASEYSSIYYVDLESNTFEVYKLNGRNVQDLIGGEDSNLSYTEAYSKCVKEIVYEPDQPAMLKAGSIYNILTMLKDRESFTTVYRANREDEVPYCEMKIARVEREQLPTHVIIGFADSSAEKTREIEKAKNISIVLQLANNFEAIYDIDIKTGKYICYSDRDIFSGERFSKAILGEDIFKGISEAADQIIFVDDRPLVKAFLTRENILRELSKKKDLQMDFRILVSGIPTWYHLKVAMDESSNGQGLIAGMFDIEEQRQKEFSFEKKMKKLTREAQYDMLTGIRNRNAYILLEEELDKTMRESEDPLALAVFDINNLKTVNDRFGHDEGDRLIKTVSSYICELFRHSPVFRTGGDEFIVILKGKEYENRKVLMETVRRTSKENLGTGEAVIASGIAERGENDNCLADIFARADDDMYINKKYLKSLG